MARKKNAQAAEVPIWEWVVAALGLLFLATTLGFLAFEAITRGDSPPDIAFESAAPVAVNDAYVVPIRAINRGGTTASRLKVAAQLLDGAKLIEEAELEFDHLAAGSEGAGGVMFKNDPRKFQLKLAAKAYVLP
jgi:uncharacterized protein (TIGR02588 family)